MSEANPTATAAKPASPRLSRPCRIRFCCFPTPRWCSFTPRSSQRWRRAAPRDHGAGIEPAAIMATVFLGVLAVNLVIFSFDFPRTTSLTLSSLRAAVVLGLLLLFQFQPHLLPTVTDFLLTNRPRANPTFYFTICAILGVIFALVFVFIRFDYWEVRNNELLHHHGFLSDLKRYSAPHLKSKRDQRRLRVRAAGLRG